ncbi:MAG: hypothetical protein E7K20_13740 [Clostridium sp.]|nr:hypothetical protein [Clostridium sp.]MDU1180590.1 hypothetical protein [Clostridium sp.]MDU1227913.1 hypothetical protein [Clostridium sp.]MDU7653892.1 hypothetical protein [Clostridium sp.]
MKKFNYKVISVNLLDNHEVLLEFDNGENRGDIYKDTKTSKRVLQLSK